MKAKISEIFDSIQGEGLYLGKKQIFVRFFGCNLGCRYCDTKIDCFAEYDLAQLIDYLKSMQGEYDSVSFTGGEPLLQTEFLKQALKFSRQLGFHTYLETNGTLPEELAEVIADVDTVAMDFKFPSSTGQGSYWRQHEQFLEIASQKEVFIKSVICSSTTDEDLAQSIRLIKKINPSVVMVLQPNCYENHGMLDEKLGRFRDYSRDKGVTTCIIGQVQKKIGIQ